MSHLEDFRRETRTWLEQNCPATMRRAASTDAISSGEGC